MPLIRYITAILNRVKTFFNEYYMREVLFIYAKHFENSKGTFVSIECRDNHVSYQRDILCCEH